MGAYTSSPSFYGTFDQGGNVWEWNEALIEGSFRSLRGGSWILSASYLPASNGSRFEPTVESVVVGFRVATIPEPSTLLLLCFGSLAVLWRRRGLVCVAILAAVAGFSCADRAEAVTIDMVTVGNPGNAPDTRYNGISVGSVDHVYQIGKYEVTAGQYTEFLNAVAKADPNGLYNTDDGRIRSTR